MKEFFDIFIAKKMQYILLILLSFILIGWGITFYMAQDPSQIDPIKRESAVREETFQNSNRLGGQMADMLVVKTKVESATNDGSFVCPGSLSSPASLELFKVTRYWLFNIEVRSNIAKVCRPLNST